MKQTNNITEQRGSINIPKDENGRFILNSEESQTNFVIRCKSQDMDLFKMASKFQKKYFTDFTLEDFKEEMQKIKILRDSERVTYYSDIAGDSYGNPDLFGQETCWIFKYCEKFGNNEIIGQANDVDREILIDKKLERYKKRLTHVLLHEMIHAYEFDFFYASKITDPTLQYLCFMRRDYLMIKLMQKLKMSKRLLSNALGEAAAHGLGNIGHTPLFALKAMELDMRLKLKLGTIIGYDKEEYY